MERRRVAERKVVMNPPSLRFLVPVKMMRMRSEEEEEEEENGISRCIT